jgi:S-adenosylmethionine-diacylglycerol 3-amino-3-carboxypropyl transferase
MNPTARVTHRAHDALFRHVHSRSLIYNTCWEDPQLDREMLQLGPDSRVVMITSAGCNALDYLLDDPASIEAIDMNPRQNALLELKLALIQQGDHAELFRVFGEGARPGFSQLLSKLAPWLTPATRSFWTAKQDYFDGSGLRRSFYYRGGAGQVAWVVRQSLARSNPAMSPFVTRLMDAGTLEEQQVLYARVEPSLWNTFNSWLVKQPLTMAMLGVPRPQIRLIESRFPGGLLGYVRQKVEHVLTKLPIHNNYFWRVYATGRYTSSCCPNYLRPENLDTLRRRATRVTTHSTTVSGFLRRHPGAYSHFVLLDHQDWLASHDPASLREEWELILTNSRPGSRILLRSASPVIEFIPADVRERLRVFPDLAQRMHLLDRVGTYGSTFLAEVR